MQKVKRGWKWPKITEEGVITQEDIIVKICNLHQQGNVYTIRDKTQ
jgi:hypothetical protein